MCAASDEVMVMKYRTVKKKKNYTVTKESFPNKAEKDEFTFTLTRNKKQKTEKKKKFKPCLSLSFLSSCSITQPYN